MKDKLEILLMDIGFKKSHINLTNADYYYFYINGDRYHLYIYPDYITIYKNNTNTKFHSGFINYLNTEFKYHMRKYKLSKLLTI